MKFSAIAADLAAPITFACRAVAAKATIDISGTVLLRTSGVGIEITGHTLSRMHTARCPAKVATPGAAAVPAVRLAALIDATPPEAMVSIAYADGTVTVAAGRSRYKLPALPAIDFPIELVLSGKTATIELAKEDIAALIGAPSELVNKDEDRLHLKGIFLHLADRKFLATAVTDGIALLCRTSTIEAPAFPGIIIPPSTVKEIDRLGRRSGFTLRTDGHLFEARVDGGRLTIVSRLVAATYPDYARVIPAPAATTVTFAAADMLAALARLSAASLRGQATVGMTWDGADALSLCLVREDDIAADSITATTTGSGRVACTTAMLKKVIEVMGVAHLRLSIEATPGAKLRLDPAEDDGTVAVIAPIPWFATASAAAARQEGSPPR
jgi:DNA polymerase-3 subunit beta